MFELMCAAIAVQFRGKQFESLKKELGIENVAYTPEIEE
jgi:hypothetical protein